MTTATTWAAARLGYSFSQPGLLQTALTRPGALKKGSADNQRLEFLGDRVLGLVVASRLYQAFPAEQEGALSKRLVALVRRETLTDLARQLELGPHLVLAAAEEQEGGRENASNLADALEAVLGAIYLDGGLAPAEALLHRLLEPFRAAMPTPPQDAKTKLQEKALAKGPQLPSYQVVSQQGPPHAPVFIIRVTLPTGESAEAEGASKRVAEQAAAATLLEKLEKPHGKKR